MPKKKSNLPLPTLNCHECRGQCCRYFALHIDRPRTTEDFDHIRWYIAHEQIAIFIEKNDWYLQINNTCKHLQTDFQCSMYDKRPKICRDYGYDANGQTECHGLREATDHNYIFNSVQELENYLLLKGKRWASISRETFLARKNKLT